MPSVSKHEHLKPEAYKLWTSGTPFTRVSKTLGIPKNTVKRWFQKFEKGEQPPVVPYVAPDEKKAAPVAPQAKIVRVRAEDLAVEAVNAIASKDVSSFVLARDTLRELCQVRGNALGIAVQAATCLLKTVQMEADLPAHILYGGSSEDNATSIEEFKNMSAEDKSIKLRELLRED